jgi:hypothetical protein
VAFDPGNLNSAYCGIFGDGWIVEYGRRMTGWMDGGQIWIALERSSGESSKDVTSVSVTHLVWKEEIILSKMEKYQNQNGRQYG